MEYYGYYVSYGYRGRVNKELDLWILFESEQAYIDYMNDMHG